MWRDSEDFLKLELESNLKQCASEEDMLDGEMFHNSRSIFTPSFFVKSCVHKQFSRKGRKGDPVSDMLLNNFQVSPA